MLLRANQVIFNYDFKILISGHDIIFNQYFLWIYIIRGNLLHIHRREDVENYQQIDYQDDEHADDLERLQGRLITEDSMNMLDDKGDEMN